VVSNMDIIFDSQRIGILPNRRRLYVKGRMPGRKIKSKNVSHFSNYGGALF
jgi:hypothetical protein